MVERDTEPQAHQEPALLNQLNCEEWMFRKWQFLRGYCTWRLKTPSPLDSFKNLLLHENTEAIALRFLIRNFLNVVRGENKHDPHRRVGRFVKWKEMAPNSICISENEYVPCALHFIWKPYIWVFFFLFLISHKFTFILLSENKGRIHYYSTNESQIDMIMLFCQHPSNLVGAVFLKISKIFIFI